MKFEQIWWKLGTYLLRKGWISTKKLPPVGTLPDWKWWKYLTIKKEKSMNPPKT